MNYKLSPSDLTFLFDSCKHCFVLKVKYGINQPSIPIPSVFGSIAYLQKEYYSGKRTNEICSNLPPGVITFGEKWVQSGSIIFKSSESTCFIKGRFDVVAELDDGTYAIIDFKTGSPDEKKSNMYSRQLHAYTYALENPATNCLKLEPISIMGLLYFVPDHCEQTGPERQILGGRLQWIPIERNDNQFLQYLESVVCLLDGTIPPQEPNNCEWCKYYASTRILLDRSQQEGSNSNNKEIPLCPICGGPMRLKSGRYGDFWSCLKYPKCKGTRNI